MPVCPYELVERPSALRKEAQGWSDTQTWRSDLWNGPYRRWLTLFSKDVRLPVQLQRAMAAEAEAAREARAKVNMKPFEFEILTKK